VKDGERTVWAASVLVASVLLLVIVAVMALAALLYGIRWSGS